MHTTPGHFGDPTPLHSTAAVAAMWAAWGDARAIITALTAVSTWGDLAGLSPAQRVGLIGPALAAVDLPPVCPALPDLPAGARTITPYDIDYPVYLDSRWPVLYLAGHLPARPGLAVGGSANPAPQGVEIARAAALAAAVEGVTVVAVLTEGASLVALRTAVAAGAKVTAVVPHSLDQYSMHADLLEQVRRGGGAVVSSLRPGTTQTAWSTDQATALAVDLSMAAVVAEAGAPPSAAASFVRAAIETERFVIASAAPAHHVPAAAMGLTVLTQPRMYNEAWYGMGGRVHERLAAGLSAADAVVADQVQLAAAIAHARGGTPPGH